MAGDNINFHELLMDAAKARDLNVVVAEINWKNLNQLGPKHFRGAIKCLFHDEKTPSMGIDLNDSTGHTYHCFGCGAEGRIFSVVFPAHIYDPTGQIAYLALEVRSH